MFSVNNKISIRQFQILLLLDIFGIGFLIIPRISAEFLAHEGFIAVLIATIMAIICAFIMASLLNMFPNKSFYEYSSIIITKPIALILTIGLFLAIILHISFELMVFSQIVKEVMLYKTPLWAISIMILLVSSYAAIAGIELRARLSELLVFIVLIPLIIVFTKAAFDIDFKNVMPLIANKGENYIKGGFAALSIFVGIYTILLSYPYLNNKKSAKKAAISIITLSGIFMALITLITISYFGPVGVTKHAWPTLEMINVTTLPGSIIERQEALMMSFFVVSIFAIINSGLFFSSVILKTVVKKGKHKYYVLTSMIIVFVISLVFNNAQQIYDVREFLFSGFAIFYMVIIPILLLIISKLRKLGDIHA